MLLKILISLALGITFKFPYLHSVLNMVIMKYALILVFFLPQLAFTQSSVVKQTITKIDIQEDPIKSVFLWITDNIRYDVSKRDQIASGTNPYRNKNFKNEAEYNEHLLKTLVNKKRGVCEDYSLLFHSIVEDLGYESYMVPGYIKRDGKLNTKVSHRWNAVKVDGEWKLYDPTWAAGYVKDGKKFVKKYFSEWYDVSPNKMLETHMPYDPIWQLSNHPISYKDFENNNTSSKKAPSIDFESLTNSHLKKGEKEKMQNEVDRSLALGDGTRLISKWRKVLTNNISTYDIQSQPQLLSGLNRKNKATVKLFNEYINAKNKRFRGKKWTPSYAVQSMEKVKVQLNEVIEGYQSLDVNDRKATKSINKTIRSSQQLLKRVDSELKFLDKL